MASAAGALRALCAALLFFGVLSATAAQAGFLEDLFGAPEPAPQPHRLRYDPARFPDAAASSAERRAKRRATAKPDHRTIVGNVSSAPLRPSQQHLLHRMRRASDEIGGGHGHGYEFGRFVCVRLCDGAVIALARRNQNGPGEPSCDSACPGAETRLFTLPSVGDDISSAVDRTDKTSYAELVARVKAGDKPASCTCGSVLTKADVDVEDFLADATLRSGDVVATSEGLHVFRGQARLPHKLNEFIAFHAARTRLPRMSHGTLEALDQTLKIGNNGDVARAQ